MAGQIIRRGERTWLVRVYLGRDGAGRRRYHNFARRGLPPLGGRGIRTPSLY